MAKQHTGHLPKPQPASAERPAASQATHVPDSSSIAALAYHLWIERGCPEGSPEIDWLRAEQELCRQSAKPGKSASTKRPLATR
jgi:hypothetical protein